MLSNLDHAFPERGPAWCRRMARLSCRRLMETGLFTLAMPALAADRLRRMVTVEDVAAMALFLASPAARNISGQAINVDANMEYL